MKLFSTILIALLLTSCGSFQRLFTRVTGELTSKCYKGVEYVQSDSGLAVALDYDGIPRMCAEDEK